MRRRAAVLLLGLVACGAAPGEPAVGAIGGGASAPVKEAEVEVESAVAGGSVTGDVKGVPGAGEAAEAFVTLQYAAGPGLEVPVVEAGARIDGDVAMVEVSREAIAVAGREVLRLVDGRVPEEAVVGHRIAALSTALVPALGESTEVVVVADEGTRHADVVDVLYTAAEAGAKEWSIGVRETGDPAGTVMRSIRVEAAEPAAGALPDELPPSHEQVDFEDRGLALYMRITATTVELGERLHTGEFRELGRVRAADGWAPVRRIAQDAAARAAIGEVLTPEDAVRVGAVFGEHMDTRPVVVFAAAGDVPLERVLAALAAITGDCSREAPKAACWFTRRVLVGGERSPRALAAGRGAGRPACGRPGHPFGYQPVEWL